MREHKNEEMRERDHQRESTNEAEVQHKNLRKTLAPELGRRTLRVGSRSVEMMVDEFGHYCFDKSGA